MRILLLSLLLLSASCCKHSVEPIYSIDQFKELYKPSLEIKLNKQIRDSIGEDIECNRITYGKNGDYKFLIYYQWKYLIGSEYYTSFGVYDFNGTQKYFYLGK